MSLFNPLRPKPESLASESPPTAPTTSAHHHVSGIPLSPPFPSTMQEAIFAMGCFWGVERLFWQTPGVHVTSVGYAGGTTPNPTYTEVCTGKTGHTEVVRIIFDPSQISFPSLLRLFWENHNPTQGMRQGNDIGSQYRSAIYTTTETQLAQASSSHKQYSSSLASSSHPPITTEIKPAPPFYYAEDYHQQYLSKNPSGYCNLQGTGVLCPLPSSA